MAKMFIVGTDNRDPTTTRLLLGFSHGDYVEHVVEVDPAELFKNMVLNCFGDGVDVDVDVDNSVLREMSDFLQRYL